MHNDEVCSNPLTDLVNCIKLVLSSPLAYRTLAVRLFSILLRLHTSQNGLMFEALGFTGQALGPSWCVFIALIISIGTFPWIRWKGFYTSWASASWGCRGRLTSG